MLYRAYEARRTLAAPLFGLAQHFGYRLAYVFATVLSTAGLLVLLLTRAHRESADRPEPAASAGIPAQSAVSASSCGSSGTST